MEKQGKAYGEGNAASARIHTLHIHVRPEKCNFAAILSIGFQAFEDSLCVV